MKSTNSNFNSKKVIELEYLNYKKLLRKLKWFVQCLGGLPSSKNSNKNPRKLKNEQIIQVNFLILSVYFELNAIYWNSTNENSHFGLKLPVNYLVTSKNKHNSQYNLYADGICLVITTIYSLCHWNSYLARSLSPFEITHFFSSTVFWPPFIIILHSKYEYYYDNAIAAANGNLSNLFGEYFFMISCICFGV